MALVYEKALKRKDFSGITAPKDKDAVKASVSSSQPPHVSGPSTTSGHSRKDSTSSSASSKKSRSDAKTIENDGKGGSKAGADTGKIV